jgi:hypothetical protein
MKITHESFAIACTIAVMLAGTGLPSIAGLKMETFDTAASAAANGWTGQNNPSFGFSNTDFTQGTSPAGEAGGLFFRTNVLAFYADTTVADKPFFDLFNRFEAHGELALVTPASSAGEPMYLGYFDRDHPTPISHAFLGFVVFQNTNPNTPFSLQSAAVQQGGTSGALSNGVYTFDMLYDPNFSGNDGRLTTTFYTNATPVLTVFSDVVAGAKNGRSARTGGYLDLDAFGLVTGQTFDGGGTLQAFVDNLAYTVPEPSAAAVLCLAGLLLWRRR